MERFFTELSQKVVNILDPNDKFSEIEHLQMYYGIQNLVYNIVITSIILILSSVWKCFTETFMLFAIFGILRLIAGGFHFNSIFKCISVTTLIMLCGGKYLSVARLSIPVCVIFAIFANITFIFHIPKGTRKNPYSQKYSLLQKRRLHFISFFITIIAFYVDKLRATIILSMFIVAIFLIPEIIHRFQSTE